MMRRADCLICAGIEPRKDVAFVLPFDVIDEPC